MRPVLGPLLASSTFIPKSAADLLASCEDWFRDEPFIVSYVFLSVFRDLADRHWDDEQGVSTDELSRFVSDVLPHLNTVFNNLPAVSIDSLDALVVAHRNFLSH
jgi:hypothetical protein